MTRTYQSVTTKLRAYFAAHPDDWLSIEDVMTKFSASRWNALKAISACTSTGKAERVSVYRAAPQQNAVSNQVSDEVSKT